MSSLRRSRCGERQHGPCVLVHVRIGSNVPMTVLVQGNAEIATVSDKLCVVAVPVPGAKRGL